MGNYSVKQSQVSTGSSSVGDNTGDLILLLLSIASRLCPMLNVKPSAISIFALLFLLISFPSVLIVILLTVNGNVSKTTATIVIVGLILFYLIILYSIYLILSYYLTPLSNVINDYSSTAVQACSKQ